MVGRGAGTRLRPLPARAARRRRKDRVDADRMIAGVDCMPTILKAPLEIDGRSFCRLLTGGSDPWNAESVRFCEGRVPEEFCDCERDPCALRSLIDEPDCAEEIHGMRCALPETMQTPGHPNAQAFETLMERRRCR